MRKLVILLWTLLAVVQFRYSAADRVLSFQRSLKDQREKESSLPPCDRKKDDICNKDSKELFKNANGQCQQHSCLYQPTVGLAQHPHSPYFKFNPSQIVASAKTILYSFKGMDGEVCSFEKQPCSCRRDDKCSCSSASKMCKQQYKVERTYFVVYNNGKKSRKSPYGAPTGRRPNMGFNTGFAQQQASPFGLGMINPFQQSYGSQQQSLSMPSGANLMSFGRSLVPTDSDDTDKENPKENEKNEKKNHKRNLSLFPSSPQQFPMQGSDSEMQKLQALAQSLSMNQAPNGFPMGMMPPGPQTQGFGGYNPYQFQGPQVPASMPQQPSYSFPPNMPPQPMPQPNEFGQHQSPQSQGYPAPGPMQNPVPPQSGPVPPAPSDPNEFQNHPNQFPQGHPIPTQTFSQNPSHFPQEMPPTQPSEAGQFGALPGQVPQGYPNGHQAPPNTFGNTHSYQQQPQMHPPHGQNPYSAFPQAPYSPPYQPQRPHHYPPNMGSPQSVSMNGNSMMTSAMFRYFLMQDKTSTTSNTFLKLLPILMSNNALSKMISFESLYVMVPDGCDCEQSDSADDDDDSDKKNRYPFFNPYQSPFGMTPGFQNPHSPFPSYAPQPPINMPYFGAQPPMNMPFQSQYPGMNPTSGHSGFPPAAFPPMSDTSTPWYMNYQMFKGKQTGFGQ